MRFLPDKNYCTMWESFITHDNREALSCIYFDHFDLLFSFGLRHTHDKQIVEDSIQNMFSYFLKVRKKLGMVENVPGYLFISFRRQLFLELKKQKKSILKGELTDDNFEFFTHPEEDNTEQENENQLGSIVRECVRKLTPKQKEILYLRFECGLTYEEISDILDITVESCHKSIYRTIKTIREEAQKEAQKKRKMEERIILFLLNKGSK